MNDLSQSEALQSFLQAMLTRYSQPKQPHSKEFCKRLLVDIFKLLDDADDYDVLIQVGEEPNVKEFHAHSVILRARCPYFRRGLSKEWACRLDNKIVFRKTNISPAVFSVILRYIYGGNIDLEHVDPEDIFDLLLAADELAIDEIFEYLQRYLIDHNVRWLYQNFVLVHQTAFEHSDFKELQHFTSKIIKRSPAIVFKADDFYMLEENLLLELLESNEIRLDEVDIWDRALRWAIAQTDAPSEEITDWNEEDYVAVESKLLQILKKIRFHQMTASEFFNNVVPFQELLPSYLFNDLLRYFLVHGSKPNYGLDGPRRGETESILTDSKHLAVVASWIDKKDIKGCGWVPYGASENPYEFKLLARGSRDGFPCSVMIDRCKGRGETIILLKIGHSNQIIGGYNPIGWDECVNTWGYSTQSFVFSLVDNENSRVLASRVNDPKCAVRTNGKDALQFGAGDLVFMYAYDKAGIATCSRNSYEHNILGSIGPVKVDDYELFLVSTKQHEDTEQI
ncbi:6383_t:CDS:2 [Paraglomus brasilianum]|uniref:6383_t:CDS:1 n=1 Tax=Paraglomus brasilianum TaxID=144538 RepID=A0A9N9FG15_9GLOM|nr:6383_t:CDS:2 [Paraglomus brasilianum]